MTTKARIEITAEDRTRDALRSVERGFGNLESNAARFARMFAGLGGVLSAGALIGFTRSALQSASALDDMAEATGASVEGLSKLTDIARIGDQDIGQVETALVRLTKALSGSEDETKGAGAALRALGLDMQALQQQAPDRALEQVAKAFARFEDGAGKTSTALALFGKSGAQLLPLLKDIAEQSDRVASLTAEQAAQAEKLEKNWNALSVSASNYARSLVSDLVPALNQVFEVANKAGLGGAIDATVGYALRKKLGIGDKNIQSEIRQQQDKLDQMIEDREKSMTPLFRPTETDIANQRNYITGLKEVARIEAMAGAGAAYGNEARKPALPFIPTDAPGGRTKKADGKQADPRFPWLETGAGDTEEALAAIRTRTEELKRIQDMFRQTSIGRENEAAQATARINEWEQIGEVSADVAQAMREAVNGFDDLKASGKDALGGLKDGFKDLEDAVDGWSKAATQSFVDFAFGAKTSIGDMLTSIAKQFAAMAIQKSVMDPLFDAFKGSDFFSAIGNMFVPAAAGAASGAASGASWGGSAASPWYGHSGGIVGAELERRAPLPTALWAPAPRFHGGLLPDEFPAVLKRGEGVFTPGQMAALGAGSSAPQSIRVEIENKGSTPQQVSSAQPTMTPDGMVIHIITDDLRRGGPIAGALSGTYGLRRGS
jgi:Lambda phage tail tape-measure protein (Tape_meas_lam_C)